MADLGRLNAAYYVIAVEGVEPWGEGDCDCAVYAFKPEAIALGSDDLHGPRRDQRGREVPGLLELYRDAEAAGFPGYSREINYIGLPRWAERRAAADND